MGHWVGDKYVFGREAQDEAKWALSCDSNAMTPVGWRRCRQIANAEPVSIDIVRRVRNFQRFKAFDGKPRDCKSRGRVAWAGWGGSPAVLREAPQALREYEQRHARKLAALAPIPAQLQRSFAKLDRGEGSREYEQHLPRIAIPKSKMSERSLLSSGFEPVLISIPEPGQARFTSWRHADGYHAHDHGKAWIMHKDQHPPNPLQPLQTAQHVLTEGLPGALGYVKHQALGGKPLLDIVQPKRR